jgi:Transposase DDE domain
MTLEDFITEVFCLVDDELKILLPCLPQRSRGPRPRLSDSEVITLEIVGEHLGIDTDKGIWEYFTRHYKKLFPRLGSRFSFIRQSANLWSYKQALQIRFAEKLAVNEDTIHIVDGLPLTVCNFKRAPRRRVFPGEAKLGRCETKGHVYCGFKGHLLVNTQGVIGGFTLTPANIDERQAAWDLLDPISGRLLGDKGYAGKNNKELLKHETGILLLSGNRKNMKEQIPKALDYSINRVRKIVETVIGQLSERYHIEKVRARDLWHLTSRIARKLLAHSIATYMNYRLRRPLLQFDGLINDYNPHIA